MYAAAQLCASLLAMASTRCWIITIDPHRCPTSNPIAGVNRARTSRQPRFRYFAKKLALKQVQPLAADDSWTDDYYLAGNLRRLSRLRFSGR
ncbi:hypothetical protein PS928_00650 [Pseudomonas fluorescens]|jgi:hypothetical protein|uniref:Uncharacterized protein n=1 Tax=Pseudomonas fluorescens TaxID=294 RepID=A0A5E7S2A9_PSEFL|nr:hypothetical protein PS928_00650 [Pseudomonas fluorescens]